MGKKYTRTKKKRKKKRKKTKKTNKNKARESQGEQQQQLQQDKCGTLKARRMPKKRRFKAMQFHSLSIQFQIAAITI